ncbi:MAG: LON peptidase substrate-binding domain-containing protein [Paracoccaceae bacterium]
MLKLADLPDQISLFPLPGALLLPRAKLPLHIFEPRYLAMIEDCLATSGRLIGMVQPAAQPKGQAGKLHRIGCAGRLTSFSETDDGRYMITLSGISRFRIESELSHVTTAYRQARVSWKGFERDIGPAESDPQLDRPAFLDLLHRYFASASLTTEWSNLRDAEDELLINALSMLCPFGPEERQALLEAPSLATRRETLVTLMEFALRAPGSDDEVMQ